jgi:hypothetical protein
MSVSLTTSGAGANAPQPAMENAAHNARPAVRRIGPHSRSIESAARMRVARG